LNILLLDAYTINQDPTVVAGTELAVQGCGSHNHKNRGE
jgi:hypothetical protein